MVRERIQALAAFLNNSALRNYKRLSNQKRKSSEFKNNTSDIKSSSKVSSTGAYNSITKTPKYLAKNGKQVYLQRVPKATDAKTNKKIKQRNQNNISVNSKPIYQM